MAKDLAFVKVRPFAIAPEKIARIKTTLPF
jgi:hypothetical protein